MLGLVLALALTQVAPDDDDECVRGRCRDRARAVPTGSSAFFEFAPSSGRGMTAACACTTPTGTKGEAMTFTRAGDATCSKQGLATTGIADGDLVVCTANQPRVESSGGVLGLRVEGARTNSGLRSAELSNAVWVGLGTSVAAPTVTADQAVAPDGTTTAERIQFAATTAVQNSTLYQVETHSVATYTATFFVKGNGTSGTLDVCLYNGAIHICTACAYVDTSWTRCSHASTSVAGAGAAVVSIGNASSYTGVARSANDVFVWGAQAELGAYATSYIPTVAAAVTRNAESPYLTVTAMTAGTYSTAGNFETTFNVTSSSARVATLWQAATIFADDYFPSNYQAFLFDGAADSLTSGTVVTTSGRVGSYYDLTNLGVCVTGVCTSTAATATINNITRVRIGVDGSSGTAGHLNGIVTRVCVDPSPTRCR